jgi:hypothetical protein
VHNVATSNGDFAFAGGNVNIQKHYDTQNVEPKLRVFHVLRLIRNLRKVHLDVLSKATPGTGVWLFRTDKFILWLDPNGNLKILWGTGDGEFCLNQFVSTSTHFGAAAGAGKSVLA